MNEPERLALAECESYLSARAQVPGLARVILPDVESALAGARPSGPVLASLRDYLDGRADVDVDGDPPRERPNEAMRLLGLVIAAEADCPEAERRDESIAAPGSTCSPACGWCGRCT